MYQRTLTNRFGFGRLVALILVSVCSPHAVADDPCEQPSRQVIALAGALSKSVGSNAKPGRFELKRLGAEHEAGKYQLAYLIDNKPVFGRRIEQQNAVSEHFDASASPSVLELEYSSGQGQSRPRCRYQITRTSQAFVARVRGAAGYERLPK